MEGEREKAVLLNGQQASPLLCKLILPTLYLRATKHLLVLKSFISIIVVRLSMIFLRRFISLEDIENKYSRINYLRNLSGALWDENQFILSFDHEHYTNYFEVNMWLHLYI
jgi:hypothetical protein